MVEAIRAGRKMMTRRAVKLAEFQRSDTPGYDFTFRDRAKRWHDYRSDDIARVCPYGRPGDRLRLLSSWATDARYDGFKPTDLPRDGDPTELGRPVFWSHWDGGEKPSWCGKLRPGRFLPSSLRWLMPIAEVTGVRVERLQDISEEDARAEGVEPCGGFMASAGCWTNYGPDGSSFHTARASFMSLWRSINGGDSWVANPWVWVVSFKPEVSR
jgi:hypothetical protein